MLQKACCHPNSTEAVTNCNGGVVELMGAIQFDWFRLETLTMENYLSECE